MGILKRGLKIDFTRDHIFYYGRVVSVNDPAMAGRIKVRIEPDDKDYETDRDLPYCYPLLPKFFNVVPKEGEAVRVIMYTTNKNKTDINRAYIGPVIGQPQDLRKQTKVDALIAGSDIGYGTLEKNPEISSWDKGLYPQVQDVAVQGRENADIILNRQEVNLRAGQYKLNKPLEINNAQPPRIQLKAVSNETSAANIIASQINLVSYRGGIGGNDISFDSLNVNGLNSGIKGAEPDSSFETGYLNQVTQPLIYGNTLVSFLELIKQYISHHEHVDGEGPPIQKRTSKIAEIQSFNLEKLKCQNIRIN